MRQPNKRAMIQPRLCIAALATITLVNAIWAEPDNNQVEKSLRLELNLTDGSRIIGTPVIASVPVQTAYAKMDHAYPVNSQIEFYTRTLARFLAVYSSA